MTNSRVLISGAGVAGPALAMRLAGRGFQVTVVERAAALRDGGYKVDVRGAGVTALKRLGVYDAARAVDTGMRRVTYVRPDGRPIASLPADLLMGRRGDDIEVMRGDLGRILFEATAGRVEYLFGDSVAALAEGPDGVDVTFERGGERHFDHVVGADGLHSVTRRLAFGEVPLRHLGAYISIFSVPNTMRLDREELMYTRPGRLLYAYAMGPDRPAQVGFTFAAADHGRLDLAAQQRLVSDAFAGAGWRSDEFLGAMASAGDFYFDSLSQVDLPRWSTGRVVLLGDAAYCASPASGQGTSLALVGAWVLGGVLGRPEGAAAYERQMRPYVEKNLAFGRRMAREMVPGSRLAIAVRNYGMRTLRFHPRKEKVIDRVLAPLHEAANAITL